MICAQRWGIGLALGVLMVALGCDGVRSRDVVADSFPSEQVAVERTVRAVLAAAEAKDFATLESLHLYGPKFSKYDDSGSPVRQDAETTRRIERAGLEAIVALRPRVEDLKVDVFGDVAIATFLMPYEVETSSVTVSGAARATLVFVNVDGAWKIAHEHFSTPNVPAK